VVEHVHGQGYVHAVVAQREPLRVGLDEGQPPAAAGQLLQRAEHSARQVQPESMTAAASRHQLAQVEPVAAADVRDHLGAVPGDRRDTPPRIGRNLGVTVDRHARPQMPVVRVSRLRQHPPPGHRIVVVSHPPSQTQPG
jgi:hypothetical protein